MQLWPVGQFPAPSGSQIGAQPPSGPHTWPDGQSASVEQAQAPFSHTRPGHTMPQPPHAVRFDSVVTQPPSHSAYPSPHTPPVPPEVVPAPPVLPPDVAPELVVDESVVRPPPALLAHAAASNVPAAKVASLTELWPKRPGAGSREGARILQWVPSAPAASPERQAPPRRRADRPRSCSARWAHPPSRRSL